MKSSIISSGDKEEKDPTVGCVPCSFISKNMDFNHIPENDMHLFLVFIDNLSMPVNLLFTKVVQLDFYFEATTMV